MMVNGSQNDDGSITARSIQSLRSFQAPQDSQASEAERCSS